MSGIAAAGPAGQRDTDPHLTPKERLEAELFAGIVIYAILAGADFGSGICDLTAGNAARGGRIRVLIDHCIGPVWEANHLRLIFVIVFM